MSLDSLVTVLIPTSPIPRHPDTNLIEACVSGIRNHFPDARIEIMVDGVREEVIARKDQYADYKTNLAKLVTEGKMGNAKLRIFSEPSQQAIMTRNVLHHHVNTPLIMFVEHDAIFRKEAIAWPAIFHLLQSGGANLIRFYGWPDIWHEHEYLMRGELPYEGARFVKTVQYSQWPLVSRTDYHRKVLNMIASDQHTMIEPAVYYQVARAPWEENKLVIYLNGNVVFEHRDGRTDEVTGQRDPAEW